MLLSRLVARTVAVGVLACGAGAVCGQNYPHKPIRLVVPGSPGSGQDVISRVVVPGLTQAFGQQIIVDNRAGASGQMGAELTAKAPGDGYTLLVLNIAHTIYASSSRAPSYNLVRDFSPVTQLASAPGAIVVHPSLPVKSLGDFIRLAKARPGVLNYASAGPGSGAFVAGEIFKILAGIDLVHVPYNGGGPAINALVAGEVSMYIAPLATATPLIRQERLRALAVTTAHRLPAVPDLPTVAESGVPGYEFSNWYGLVAPATTARATVVTVRNTVVQVLKRPEVNKSLTDLGLIPVGDQPQEFAAFLKSQVAMLTKIFQQNKLTTE